mgnify:CR=1 FL=1
MRLLALDQASRVTGVAIFDDDKLVKYGTFEIKSNQELGKRLTQFLENLDKLYAAYHFKGFPQFLFMVYQEIFCRWLSKTGNQLDERRPIFDIYRLVGEDGYMEIDICFPLK